ncbi:SIMPL domain-containing protein [Thalassotalea sp. PP2-459]|uniref:SIMPL domain-containing protein n=1 Tax=Thalassotalea sp. PP2-459 TaxID=1742724 RepID=UPI000942B577|nr:SIMPL domain-containing protein [Thalassotalea sp. PP2-459]OKY25964.1 hypothetical protein BI291_02600 [Thalassotalea sp. PP2-459]
MLQKNSNGAFILGVFICIGLITLGYFLSSAAITYKQYERSVKVKGLAERELSADVVIWPIQFAVANNNLEHLYRDIEQNAEKIKTFITKRGIDANEMSLSAPAITDKSAQQYGNNSVATFRYTAIQTVTVYSTNIESVRQLQSALSELGKQGIVFTGGNYQSRTEYLFTRLNDIKPDMIEEATRNAREVAEKFALDSNSQLGKIKRASQGQFSISSRDTNNPHIKRIRVVSTLEYYLSD